MGLARTGGWRRAVRQDRSLCWRGQPSCRRRLQGDMHNLLRLQTQQRLEADFLGWDTNPDSASPDGRRRAVGVGLIPPRLIIDSLTFAALNGDFSLGIARQANF